MTGREQFETIYMKREPEASMAFNESVGRYKYVFIQSQYEFFLEAWQASREALEIDIDWPEANDDTWKDGEEGAYAMGHEDGKDKVIIAVRKAIRAAGIKVKGE